MELKTGNIIKIIGNMGEIKPEFYLVLEIKEAATAPFTPGLLKLKTYNLVCSSLISEMFLWSDLIEIIA